MSRLNATHATWMLFFLAALCPPHALAQQCTGDTNDSFSLTSTDGANPTRVQIWSRTRLIHGQAHLSCAGIVGVRSELWFESDFTGCTAGPSYNSAATAPDSPANHERTTQRWCTVYLCGLYHARGRYLFDGSEVGGRQGNAVPGGDCNGNVCNPCTPGYVVGGDCAPHLQDRCGCCPEPSPLIIDRTGDGLHLSNAENGALLDINGYGAMFWLGWPTTADDAWLAYDRNHNGLIDNGSELFGNTRRLASGRNAENGYEVLAELDENRDGLVDSKDPVYGSLLLWGDANRNGVSEPKELITLAAAGIRKLGVEYVPSDKTDAAGNRFRFFASDGSSADVFPIWRPPDSVGPSTP